VGTAAPWTHVAARAGIESWNVMPPPQPGSAEQGYLLELLADAAGDTRVLLSGLMDDEAISLRFNRRSLPYFTLWRNTPAENDGYVMGLEPATNFPNPHSFEKRQGRVVALQPGQSWRTEVAVAWYTEAHSIAQEEAAIHAIQADHLPELLSSPRADWSANP
jgi:hypothetical protein